MTPALHQPVGRRLSTPRAAAVAGLVFALLFGGVIVLVHTAWSSDPRNVADLAAGASRLQLAITLMPFAGIAFLWFLGVVRDRIGDLEDRFFASVMLGSGLLFLAMLFIAMALAGGILASALGSAADVDVLRFGREVMFRITNVYALRMAAVFMISLGTIWLRTGVMPRWLVIGTYLLALALLVVTTLSVWVTLVFPAWVLLVSAWTLVTAFRREHEAASDAEVAS